MADTFYSLNVHCVFSTKNREPLLVGETKDRLWAFMGRIAKQNRIKGLESTTGTGLKRPSGTPS
jgi:REP element-mobilizing transposase RayT